MLVDPSYGDVKNKWKHMNPAEKSWCKPPSRWKLCIRIGETQSAALGMAEWHFPSASLTDGRGDAFRHCYWNVLMTKRFGYSKAAEVATRHEAYSSGLPKVMDLRNNFIGRAVAGQSANEVRGRDECTSRANTGRLWIIQNGALV